MASGAKKVFEYMILIGQLKRVRRTGWVLRGVTNPESVSDHMYRVAMTAILAPPPLNTDKCVKMALVHDMAECIVGDLTPHDNVSKEEKHRREEEATQRLCSLVGEPVGTELYTLWQEYESQETEESRFVKDLDRLDMVVQAYEYEQQEKRPGFLQEFFDSTEGKFQTELAQSWHCHLKSVRERSLPRRPEQQPTSNENAALSSSCSMSSSQMIQSEGLKPPSNENAALSSSCSMSSSQMIQSEGLKPPSNENAALSSSCSMSSSQMLEDSLETPSIIDDVTKCGVYK